MPAPKVVRSARARKDVRDLYVWIVEENGFDRAEQIVARIEMTVQRLADRPLLGRSRPDLAGEPRSFPAVSWLIVYEPLKDGPGIHLLCILDNRRDIAALLGKKS